MISVERVISQQFPAIETNHPLVKNTFLRFLRFLFHENEFQLFAKDFPHLIGVDFIEQVLEFFEFDYVVKEREIRNVPSSGRVVVIANHPIGSLDGLVLLKMLSNVRSDVKVVANELLWAIEPLRSMLLPVNNMGGKTPKENMANIERHLQNEGALLIFPAGEVSRLTPTGIKDGTWHSGFLRFANKTQSPILPIHVEGKNSAFFYGLSMLAKPLSTLWLVHEMFKQQRSEVRLRVANVVEYGTYSKLPISDKQKVKRFKKQVYAISKQKNLVEFASDIPSVAHPEASHSVKAELQEQTFLGKTSDGKHMYCFSDSGDSAVMREIGRLREMTFRAVGEGSGKPRDIDVYDRDYDHIILWDDTTLEIVGAYRLKPTQSSSSQQTQNLYTQTLFDLTSLPQSVLAQGLELGRSFVQPKYWGKRSLDYLWQGVGAYLKQQPNIRYLFGAVTISNELPEPAKASLVRFYQLYFPGDSKWAVPQMPFEPKPDCGIYFHGDDYAQEFGELKSYLKKLGCQVPTLYKQYAELCEDSGTQFLSFNKDPDFCDCIDGLVLVDITKMKAQKRARYLQLEKIEIKGDLTQTPSASKEPSSDIHAPTIPKTDQSGAHHE